MIESLGALGDLLDISEVCMKNIFEHAENIGGHTFREYLLPSSKREYFPEIYESGGNTMFIYACLCELFEERGLELGPIMVEFTGEVYGIIMKGDSETGVVMHGPFTRPGLRDNFPEEHQRIFERSPPGYA
ncbi:MAG: hypothetical protein ACP5E4_03310 [Candidatus Aenigmatarchaeota archaeon]